MNSVVPDPSEDLYSLRQRGRLVIRRCCGGPGHCVLDLIHGDADLLTYTLHRHAEQVVRPDV
jgi:hypothetical protein